MSTQNAVNNAQGPTGPTGSAAGLTGPTGPAGQAGGGAGGLVGVLKHVGDSPYAAATGDAVVCDATGGAMTVRLPTLSAAQIAVKKKDSSANNVTVVASGSDIDGTGSIVLSNPKEAAMFIGIAGEGWNII